MRHFYRRVILSFACPAILFIATSCRSNETIGHQWLREECQALGTNDAELLARSKRLDMLATESIGRIRKLNVDDKTPDGVKRILSEIDSVLVENNYVVFINTKTLSDALTPGIPTSGGAVVRTPQMESHRKKFPDATYYRFDCDTGTIIYLDILQRLGEPVVMFETPKHNCLRWDLSPTKHINWDVNDAASYTDDEHRQGVPHTAGNFDLTAERSEHYLLDMTSDEVEAYHLAIVAGLYKARGKYDQAIECYEASIVGRPYVAMPRNNLAWMIATEPSLQTSKLHELALTMAQSAVDLEPKNGNHVDTLAAVYAARHEFEKAIAVESAPNGRQRQTRLDAYQNRCTPVDMNWRLEPDE